MSSSPTPDYHAAQRQFYEAASNDDRLIALRQMLMAVPDGETTQKIRDDLSEQIRRLELAAMSPDSSEGHVAVAPLRRGTGQVAIIGPANVGKSLLVDSATQSDKSTAESPEMDGPVTGTCHHGDMVIQLVDMPSLSAAGFAPDMLDVVRTADVICIVVDGSARPLWEAHMVCDVFSAVGLDLRSVPRSQLDDASQRSAIIAVNKIDLADPLNIEAIKKVFAGQLDVIPISASGGDGMDELLGAFRRFLD